MKLSDDERRGFELGMQHAASIDALTRIIEGSTLTRAHLCRILVGLAFAHAGCDESAAREDVYRLLTLAEASLGGEIQR